MINDDRSSSGPTVKLGGPTADYLDKLFAETAERHRRAADIRAKSRALLESRGEPQDPVDRRQEQVEVTAERVHHWITAALREYGVDGVEMLLTECGFLTVAHGINRKEWRSAGRRWDDDMASTIVVEVNKKADPQVRITDVGGCDILGPHRRQTAGSVR